MIFFKILFKWQTIIGAFLGGLFALATALLVAYSIRRRDEIAAGIVVISNMAAVIVASETINKKAKEDNIGDIEYPHWFSEMLLNSHPKPSTLFESSVSRILPIDTSLAAHLSLFLHVYSEIEFKLEKLSLDYDHYHKQGKPLRDRQNIEADCQIIAKHFSLMAEHSKCAIHIINKLVLSRFPTFHRIRRYICMNEEEKKCKEFLKKGSI